MTLKITTDCDVHCANLAVDLKKLATSTTTAAATADTTAELTDIFLSLSVENFQIFIIKFFI